MRLPIYFLLALAPSISAFAASNCEEWLTSAHHGKLDGRVMTTLERPHSLGTDGQMIPVHMTDDGFVVSSVPYAEAAKDLMFLVHESSSGKLVQEFHLERDIAARRTDFMPVFIGNYAVAAGYGEHGPVIKRWKLGDAGHFVEKFSLKKAIRFNRLTASNDGKKVLLVGDEEVYLVDLTNTGNIVTLEHPEAINKPGYSPYSQRQIDASFSQDGNTILINFLGAFGDQPSLWDANTGKLLHFLKLDDLHFAQVYETHFLGNHWALIGAKSRDRAIFNGNEGDFYLLNTKNYELKVLPTLPWYKMGWHIPVHSDRFAALIPRDSKGRLFTLDLVHGEVHQVTEDTSADRQIRFVSFFHHEPLGIVLFESGEMGIFDPDTGKILHVERFFPGKNNLYPNFDERVFISKDDNTVILSSGPKKDIYSWQGWKKAGGVRETLKNTFHYSESVSPSEPVSESESNARPIAPWTETPLNFEDWKKITHETFSDSSLELRTWAFYVIQAKPNETSKQLKSRYRKLAARFHPDRAPNFHEVFKLINRAAAILSVNLR